MREKVAIITAGGSAMGAAAAQRLAADGFNVAILSSSGKGAYAADNLRMNNVLPGWIDSRPEAAERRQSCSQ